MGKLIVELPNEVHRELKKKAADRHKTIKDIITCLVGNYLHTEERQEAVIKKTSLCGKWSDEKTADEIIRDIKTHRRWFAKERN
ncbi:MAG: hypothetical protein HY756_12435 [Nitrospirae bacterium]|nr:hypothetical protein [Nitrospirota bacterium]